MYVTIESNCIINGPNSLGTYISITSFYLFLLVCVNISILVRLLCLSMWIYHRSKIKHSHYMYFTFCWSLINLIFLFPFGVYQRATYLKFSNSQRNAFFIHWIVQYVKLYKSFILWKTRQLLDIWSVQLINMFNCSNLTSF